jgi:dolichyl-diphosphooligosaccharide--protein glycosyltransferase
MASNDSYRWLRYAKEMRDGSFVTGQDALSAGTPLPVEPMVSRLVEVTASVTGSDIETTASLLTVFLSGLFVFPLGIYLYLNGMSAAAIGGGVVGGLCFAYLQRTTAFQPDTDMLNLFLPLLTVLFIYLAGRGRTLLFSALAGFVCYLHCLWYVHPGFALVWLFVLGLHLAIVCKNRKLIIYSLIVFIIFCSPFQVVSGFRNVFEFFSESPKSYHADVAELYVRGFWDSLRMITNDGYSALAGIVLFAVTLRRTYLLLPLFLLGLLMFFKGERFGMYLGMFAGIGFGVLFQYVFSRVKFGSELAVSAVFLFCLTLSGIFFVPAPYIKKDVFEELAKLKIPADSVVATHWNNGFVLQYLKGVRTTADGASQFKEGWHLTQKLLESETPDKKLLEKLGGGKDVWLVLTEEVPFKGGSHGYFPSDGLDFTNIEHNSNSGLKLHRNGAYFSVFNNKTENSIFGKSVIIGSLDIGCFRLVYRNYPFIAAYKAGGECFASE